MRGENNLQLSFGETFIDPSLFELDDELTQVDTLLSQRELVRPFEACFDETVGRPGTPVAVYLRMMYLKFRWGLSYEELEAEGAASVAVFLSSFAHGFGTRLDHADQTQSAFWRGPDRRVEQGVGEAFGEDEIHQRPAYSH